MRMNENLRQLAERIGMPISDRCSYNAHMWDGKTLASFFQNEIWNEDCTSFTVEPPQPFDDFKFAHEIAHWIVADPVEREFPEFGCAWEIDHRANGGFNWDNLVWGSKEWLNQQSIQSGVLTDEEQDFREACADFLGVYWCDQFGIPVDPRARPVFKYGVGDFANFETGWRAIVWLRENGFMA